MYTLNNNLAMDMVRVTEAAALASSKWVGKGDEKAADQAAVTAMRSVLNKLNIDAEVVIGEGERDEAPMLFIGEKVGNKQGPQLDIALDPLEGTAITAQGGRNALAVIAAAKKGHFLNAPDVYMDKIAVGITEAKGKIGLHKTVKENIQTYSEISGKAIEDILVCVLNRPRHEQIIKDIREIGSRISLIEDGDVAGVMVTADKESDIDLYIGSGGAPEGVLAAAALQCTGGYMEGRLTFRNDDEIGRAKKLGIEDLDKIYTLDELAHGEIFFAATGVTDGTLLKGVKLFGERGSTHSIVMRASTGTVRFIEADHNFTKKDWVF